MAKVWFRCNNKNKTMFILQADYTMDYIPMVGDIIIPRADDFRIASFRVKPFRDDDDLKNIPRIHFKVISREYDMRLDEWELLCEPTAESLLFLLKHIKTN